MIFTEEDILNSLYPTRKKNAFTGKQKVIREIKRKQKRKRIKMNFLALRENKSSNLAKPMNINELIDKKAGGIELIPYLKILSGQTKELTDPNLKDLNLRIGDMLLPNERLNLGKEVKVLIGPWRYKGMRIENGNVTLVDYNLTKNSRYIPEQNDWSMPDGITPSMQSIYDGQSNGSTLLNDVGKEILFYLPEYQIGFTLWLKGTMLTMSKIFESCKANPGKFAVLVSEQAKSKKYVWFIPHIRILSPQEEINLPDSFLDTVELFLNPGIVYDPDNVSEKPR